MKDNGLILLILLASASVIAPLPVRAETGASAVPDHLMLTWSADPATTQTITWRTDGLVKRGVVEFQAGAKLTHAANTAQAISAAFDTDQGTCALFTASLTGLKSHTHYAYRVGDGEHWSDTHTFTTSDPRAPVKFLIFGDSQSGLPNQLIYGPWDTTVHNAYHANPDAQFLVNMGDLVEVGQSMAHWNAWFDAAKGVVDAIPEQAVEGNHETYLPGVNDATKPVFWNRQFPLPQNGPAGLKNQVYSYDVGNIHCVVLDSQSDEEHKYGDILQSQAAWLDADLAASKATWKLAFFHKTPYDLKANRANPTVKAAFCPVLEKYHVDVVFNGHDHGIGRTYAIKNDVCYHKPSQGTIYLVTGRSGNKTYSDLSKKVWNTYFFNPLDQPVYMVVSVNKQKMTIKTVKQDGTLVNDFFIDKAADTDSDSDMALPAAMAK